MVPNRFQISALFLSLLFGLLCIGAPVLSLFLSPFESALSWNQWAEQFLDPEILNVVKATVNQAFWSVLFSGILGLFLGWILGALPWQLPAIRVSRLLLLLPFGVPTVVAGTAWVKILSGSAWAYSLNAVILAHVFFNTPWVALVVGRAQAGIPFSQIEAARTLGAGSLQIGWKVIWPSVRLSWFAAMAQVGSLCISSFALVLILGGGPPVQTIETAIFARLRFGSLDWNGAIVLALWQIGLSLLPWALILWVELRKKRFQGSAPLQENDQQWVRGSPWGSYLFLFVSLFFLLPYFSVGLRAFQISEGIISAFRLSILLAAVVAIGSVGISLLQITAMEGLKRWPFVQFLLGLLQGFPSTISVLVLGLGFLLTYGRWVDPFEGSVGIIAVIQIVIFSPLAFRILWPIAQTRPQGQWDAAGTLGASAIQRWRVVEWPRWRRPLASALGLVGGAALGEVAAVSLFYSEQVIPMPLLISRFMGQYRFEEAQGASLLLLLGALSLTTLAWIWGEGRDWAR